MDPPIIGRLGKSALDEQVHFRISSGTGLETALAIEPAAPHINASDKISHNDLSTLHYIDKDGKYRFTISLSPVSTYIPEEYQRDFDKYLKYSPYNIILPRRLKHMNFEEYNKEKAKFEKAKALWMRRVQPHPFRNAKYLMKTYPVKKDSRPGEDNIDWIVIDWLRQLSSVNTIFRQEVGDVLWKRTCISITGTEDDISLLQDFLEDKPALYSLIKSLHFEIYTQPSECGKEEMRKFGLWCQFASENLKLEEVHLVIYIQAEELEELLDKNEAHFQN
ncbi:hypothetical protein G7Y89_g9027 [Cudoniella acicularis]|uniref:Uncharacterized protein n=1 Tax=Cudoniella acicularis TaxID=354080 RepID=A0A8H4RJ67_9HELO|nr:hypothetical protein G7Y89_g9027 [Cudoniella acicularis]